MTKRKAPDLPEYDLPDNSIGCMRTALFIILVEGGIALFIWLLTLMF